jgi:parallel beta-helix repeat protein
VNGNDSAGNGSAADPFATLARAEQAMENSSIKTTYVEGGTYELNSSLIMTSADDGMAFIAMPGESPVINGAGYGLINLVTLDGAQGVTLQGLTFENTTPGYYNGAVTLYNSTSNNIVGNLFSNNDRGLLLDGSSNNVISGNEIDNSVTAGINAGGGSDNNTIDSNIINGVSISAISDTSSGGIFLSGGGNYNAITHNLIENTGGPGINLNNWVDSTSNANIGNTISYNSVVNADDSSQATDSGAIYLDGAAGLNMQTVISNNSVNQAFSPSSGLNVGIYLDDFTSGVTVTNNISTGGDLGFEIHGGENDTLSNNIFDLGTNTTGAGGLIQSDSGGPIGSMTGDVVSQNIFYWTATGSPNAYWVIGGSANVSGNDYYDSNGQPIANTGVDSNATLGNPQFANEPGGDFTLGSSSAAGEVGFQSINQSAIGLTPTTVHWY